MSGSNKKNSRTFATALIADKAFLLTSLESSCNAETRDVRISRFVAFVVGLCWIWLSRSLPNALVEVSRIGNCVNKKNVS